MRAIKILLFVLIMLSFESCLNYTSVVGSGAKGTEEITQKNNYFIEGLIKGKTSDSKAMAGGAANYKIHTRITFWDGFLWVITAGIYSPTTTTVTK